MEYKILLRVITESCDEYLFRLKNPLSDKEFEIFVQDNLPNEYLEDGEMTISDYEFIDLESIKKINI